MPLKRVTGILLHQFNLGEVYTRFTVYLEDRISQFAVEVFNQRHTNLPNKQRYPAIENRIKFSVM